jgi:suppressor of fused-like protein
MNSLHQTALPAQADGKAAAPPAPGRDALVHALDALYSGRQPRLFDNPLPRRQGGEDPLDAIAVWRRAEPLPHWHYVTHGFTELYAKHSGNPLVSGFGFELTFRLACEPGATEPPLWPMHLLQSLACYVFKSGNAFHDGHRLSTNGPITLGSPTRLGALGFAFDPELPAIDTPNGHLAFLQVIGLAVDEERAAQQWETRKLLDLLRARLPLWITDLKRASLLDEPAMLARVNAGIAQDGSSCVAVYADVLEVRQRKRLLRRGQAEITLGARQIAQLAELLPLRLPFGRAFTLAGPRWKLQFTVARRNRWRIERGVLKLFVARASVHEFATLLHPHQGVYKLPAFQNILWDVRQTTIRSPHGDVVDVFGADRRQRQRA